jgi:hypothetical protein
VYGEDDGYGTSESDDPTEDAASAENLAFGETYTFEDGVSITVSAPEPFTPSDYADTSEQAADITVSITLTNGTGANFDPSLVYSSVTSGGVEGDRVFDSAQKVGLSPTTAVPDGQSISWLEGYSVADPAQLVLQISPGYDYEDVVYVS